MVENTSVKVDGDLDDDEVLNFAGGIVIIHNPGHTHPDISASTMKNLKALLLEMP